MGTTSKSAGTLSAGQAMDARGFRLLLRQMSQAFRDSEGGGLLERCEEISKLLFCKLHDERHGASLEFTSPFARVPSETDEQVYSRAVNLYENAIRLYPRTFASGQRSLSEDHVAVVKVIRLLREVNLSAIPLDIKGVAYEELLKNTLDKTENQQYFTPRPVVNFMAELVDCDPGVTMCDPACGSGGFLIAVFQHLQQKRPASWQPHLTGIEIDRRMTWIAQMNLLMHGAEEEIVHCLSNGGALAFNSTTATLLPDSSVDVILTNPPFGSDFTDRSELARYDTGRGRSSRRRGVLFTERCIRALKPGGLLGIVIEESVLNSSSNWDVRQYILRHTDVEAVISLPDVAFMPYSTAKTSILFLRKKARAGAIETQGHVFMADVQYVGRRPNGDPEYADERGELGWPVLLSDLPTVAQRWREWAQLGRPLLPPNGPVFICSRDKILRAGSTGDNRLDILFYHAAREEAERTLQRSAHRIVKLGNLVVERNVDIVPSREMPDDVCRYVGLANIMAFTGEYSVSEVLGHSLKSSVRQFRGGDILFSKLRPELRKCCLVSEQEDEGYVSSECYVFTPRVGNKTEQLPLSRDDQSQEVLPEYLAYILRSDLVFGQLVYQITGLGRPRVPKAAIMNLLIPLPSLSEQRRLVGIFREAWRSYLSFKRQAQLALEKGEGCLRAAYDTVNRALCPD